MDDLISRQMVIDNLERYRELFSWDDGDRERAILSRVIMELQSMPSAEKKGQWIVVDGQVVCSECYNANIETNYCPYCGADMMEESE